jgi:cobalt-precorrin 5A hydrolase
MSALAAGLGCRAGCAVEHVVLALTESLALHGRSLHEVSALYTVDFKRGEHGLIGAAQRLDKPIVALALGELRLHAERALSASQRSLERCGLPSVAETAALGGAALLSGSPERTRLLGPRTVHGGATCALASAEALAAAAAGAELRA